MAVNDFQAAIDYLIANRNTAKQTNPQGMFTADVPQTPTTAISPTVVDTLFGDVYKKRPDAEEGNNDIGRDPTNTGSSINSPFGPPTANDVAAWSSREAAAKEYADSIGRGVSFAGGLLGLGPLSGLIGVGAKYGIPAGLNYIGNRSYDNFLRDQDARAANVAAGLSLGGVGTYSDRNGNLGTISNQGLTDAYDRATFGITGAEMNAARGDSGGGGGFTDAGGGVVGGDQTGYDGNW
jgi:hypothetical protein